MLRLLRSDVSIGPLLLRWMGEVREWEGDTPVFIHLDPSRPISREADGITDK